MDEHEKPAESHPSRQEVKLEVQWGPGKTTGDLTIEERRRLYEQVWKELLRPRTRPVQNEPDEIP